MQIDYFTIFRLKKMTQRTNMTNNSGILQGMTVLDCSQILAGPYCSMILADMGARVIKIEKPKGGDDIRTWGPFKEWRICRVYELK